MKSLRELAIHVLSFIFTGQYMDKKSQILTSYML